MRMIGSALGVFPIFVRSILFGKGFFTSGTYGREDDDREEERRNREQRCRNRAFDESHQVAAREEERSAQVLFEHRSEDEAQK